MNCDREGTTMNILNFTFKLLKHGGIFLLRAFGILAPVVVDAFATSVSRGGRSPNDKNAHHVDLGYFPDGTPYYTNSSDAQWEAHHGDRK